MSEKLVASYLRDGYVVVPSAVDPAARARLLEDIERFEAGHYRTMTFGGTTVDQGSPTGPILAVHFPHWVSSACREMITYPGVADWVQRLAGAHLPDWDGAVRCMQSMLFVKPPGLPGQAWHQDERYIPTRDRSLIGAWIALDDAAVANGCLWVLPGSHRPGRLWPTARHEDPEEFDQSDAAHGFDDAGAVAVEVAAGDVVFFNGYLLHRSLRNRSAGCRRALVNHYSNAWSPLPWSIPPQSLSTMDIATLDFRMVVPVGPDPQAECGYEPTPDVVFIRPHHRRAPS